MAVGAVATGVSVTFDAVGLLAVGAWLPFHFGAKTQECMVIGGDEMEELGTHFRSIAGEARRIRHSVCCHKPPFSTRRSHQCSTARMRHRKPLFNTCLNSRTKTVEQFLAELRVCFGHSTRWQVGWKSSPVRVGWVGIYTYISHNPRTARSQPPPKTNGSTRI